MKKVILVEKINSVKPPNNDIIIADRNFLINFFQTRDFSPSVNFMKELPNLRIEGKTVKEWFRYDNISLWWFVHTRIWPRIEQCTRFIDGFTFLLENLKPELIELRGFFEYADIIIQICKETKVKLIIPLSSKGKILEYKINRNFRKLIVKSNLATKRKERIRRKLGKHAYKKLSNIKQVGVIYVSFQSYRAQIYDLKTGKIQRGEHLVQNILEGVKKKTDLLCLDIDSTAKGEFNVLKERLEDKGQLWIPLEVLFTNDVEEKCKKPINEVRNNLHILFKNIEFQKKISYKKVNLWKTVDYYFETLFAKAYVPNFIYSIEGAKQLLSQMNPNSVLLVYERGPYSLAFNVAANDLGIKSVGLQHGIMDKQDHIYSIEDLDKGDSELGCPIPTKMLVYGDYYKQLLIDGASYPAERLSIVGYPTFDGIEEQQTNLNKSDFLKNLGIEGGKKIILVATSRFQKYHGAEDYDVLVVKTLAEKLANNKNFHILLKPHPRENINVYKKIIEGQNISNFTIINNPLQQAILICDVFVTVMTTAILEAIVLKKPVVMVKISKNINLDYLSLVKSGAVIQSNLDNLINNILQLMENSELVNELNEKGKKLVKIHFNHPSSKINENISEVLVGKQ